MGWRWGVWHIQCSARWEATLPTLGGDACDTPPWGLKASMAVYRVQESSISQLTREKDLFFLGADFEVPRAKLLAEQKYLLPPFKVSRFSWCLS